MVARRPRGGLGEPREVPLASDHRAPSAPAALRKAATVLLLRDGADGPEIFMVQRNRRAGFLPNAWVFPGGRVDDADHLGDHPGVRGALRVPGEEGPGARAIGVAAARETFEESGLWLGERPPSEEARRRLLDGGAFVDLLAEAVVDLGRLRAWGWWVTPEVEPKRFDTRFLVARAPEGEAAHDQGETVASAWISPRRVLEAREQSGFPLAPPTWWTLRELAPHDTVDAVLEAADSRPAGVPIQPILEFGADGVSLKLPGHPDHAAPAVEGFPDGITWDGRTWVAWRGGDRLT